MKSFLKTSLELHTQVLNNANNKLDKNLIQFLTSISVTEKDNLAFGCITFNINNKVLKIPLILFIQFNTHVVSNAIVLFKYKLFKRDITNVNVKVQFVNTQPKNVIKLWDKFEPKN